ncbi:myb/SANT-like DNA-binding domain-containing protein 4 [Plodia interpunctella]|uniref:myb/SANT-like DNA-binding domain-containing protein 4 n=1 Tax=Plodia interpunctella TaxID=58824 RepID=UPI002367E224|nr:myb/SANT-like DNA-binding domain-containing protein 4 [Plodia interpunctella]
MNKVKKRERNVNFTREETEQLISLIEAHKYTIENKKSGAVTWHEKEKAWKAIEVKFNRSGHPATFRNSKHLKLKYEALKRDTRRKIMRIGSPNELPLTPVENRVKDLMLIGAEGSMEVNPDCLRDVSENVESTIYSEEPGQFVNVKVEVDVDTADNSDSSTITSETSNKEAKKRCLSVLEEVMIASRQTSIETNQYQEEPLAEWENCPKSKKHRVLNHVKEKCNVDQFAERKMEVLVMQKKLIQQELALKDLKTQLVRDEIRHKQDIFDLQKEEILLKIQILKAELEYKKKLL